MSTSAAASRVADILASLVAGGAVDSWPDQLVTACQRSTGVSGVGLALLTREEAGGVLAATAGPARQLERLQFSVGEGPCIDAARSGAPVLCPDVAGQGSARWPAFGPGAVAAGVRAAFTFPLQVGAIGIGVLDLHRDTRGPLSDAHLAEALAYAEAAVTVVLHVQDRSGSAVAGPDVVPAVGGRTGEAPWPPAAADSPLTSVLSGRAVVHQATGMISVQLGVPLAEALARLRAHVYSRSQSMEEVSEDVVARRLRFDHTDTGVSSSPTGGSGRLPDQELPDDDTDRGGPQPDDDGTRHRS
ncbi:GAF and ANTAR domain-containing protein [Goekera deserti]|uniref:GAF and ANTAR domain-containing protein n=1 Tax=Goekera deserti TaxID=2497753 RepID=A0A7K3WDU8_9ACTN|nr:GAF and ANTAR domain-containing protein [Goekera deserti]NDI46419.1 GAF domain-containing protein [Goekera deserti]NEL54648.1 GAF and ANTAR domain-containing protein [Goekera deserti]